MKQLPIVVLKWHSYVVASLYSLCVLSVFEVRARFDVKKSHVFLQGVLATITLVGSGAGDGGPRAGVSCDVGFPSVYWP